MSPLRRALGSAALLGALLVPASTAAAADVDVATCGALQPAMTAASDGDVLRLAEGLECFGPFSWTNKDITLLGLGSGATIKGPAGGQPLLKVDDSSITLRNLTFRDNSAGMAGGGLQWKGGMLTLRGMRFSNLISTDNGGAVAAETPSLQGIVTVLDSTFTGNASGGTGGGLALGAPASVVISGSTFRSNTAFAGGGAYVFAGAVSVTDSTFAENTARDAGGAAALATAATTVRDSVFERNVVEPTTNDGRGAGLALSAVAFPAPANLGGNRFSGNLIRATTHPDSELVGAGLFAAGHDLDSRGDRFVGNSLPVLPPGPAAELEGAGLSVTGCAGASTTATLTNAVIAGNTAAGPAEGSGAYFGCPTTQLAVRVRSSTISGNTSSGGTAGVDGGPSDTLEVDNSIIAGNSGGVDLSDFASRTVRASDVCVGGAPAPGAGNQCADPKLVDAASGDVRQTAASPTIDKGDTALVPPSLLSDAFGGLRVLDGDGNGSAVVDQGAHEAATPAPAPPPVTPPVTPPSSGPSDALVTALLKGIVPTRLTRTAFTFVQPVPGAGTLRWTVKLGSTTLGTARRTARAAGAVSVKVTAGKRARARLAKLRRATLAVTARYTAGGVTRSATTRVTIRRT